MPPIKIADVITKDLLATAYSLESLGIKELAWEYQDILKIINFLNTKKYIILGGDVYKKNHNTLSTTYDNWFFKRKGLLSNNILEESKNQALNYIQSYEEKNGCNYCYSVVAQTENQTTNHPGNGINIC